MIIKGLTAASLALAGCGQEAPPTGTGPGVDGGAGQVQTRVEGQLYTALRGAERRIEVVDLLDGVTGAVRCETTSSREGNWSCDLGPLYGNFLVKAETGASAPMLAVADGVVQGSTKGVVISPFTHLTAAYLESRLAKGETAELAIPNARRLMHGHFGMVQHHRVSPADVDETVGSVLDETLVSGFLLSALERLAADIAEANGQAPGGSIDGARLLSALAADVRADAVFDGRGTQGILRLGETELSGDTLRADYGRALLGFVESEANTTGFVRSDFESLAARLAGNTSELFPEDVPEPLDDTPPTLVAIEVAKDPAQPLPADAPVTGDVFVTVEARDPSGLASFTLEHQAVSRVDVGAGEALGATGYRWQLDAKAFANGANEFLLSVTDGAGNTAERVIVVVIDNLPPTIIAEALGRSRSSTVGVSGTVSDNHGPVVSLTVTPVGQSPIVLEAPERDWSVTVELECDGQDHAIEVRAVDGAGNEASRLVEAGCDDSAPALQVRPTTYFDGDQVDAIYSPDGRAISYPDVDFPAETTIETVGPHRFVKYFTRLDAWSPELPVLGVVAEDDRGDAQLSVRYRYLVDGILVRGWTAAQTDNRYEWSVPVSYQGLGVELATAGPNARHDVEVRATDAAGNRSDLTFTFTIELKSPPVWFGGCEADLTLQQYTLANRNLHEVYVSRGQTPALAGQVHYRLGVRTTSLAPRGAVRVRAVNPDIRTHFETVRLDGHPKATQERLPWSAAQPLLCNIGMHRFWTGQIGVGVDDGCRNGAFPRPGRPWRTRAADGRLNDDIAHPVAVGVESSTGPVLQGRDLRFPVGVDEQHFLHVSLDNPTVRVRNQPYAWPTDLGLPADYVATSVPPRYRGFPEWEGSGADILRHWLGANGGMDVQRFVTRPYLSSVSIEMQPVQLDATHADLEVEVPIQLGVGCGGVVTYATSL